MSILSSNGPLGSALLMEKTNPKSVVSSSMLNALPSPFLKGELPAIKLTNSMYNKGLNQWKFSLIGRLDLNRIKLEEAKDILCYQWNIAGEVKLIPLGKGFFAIKLDNEKDKTRISSGGSWKVADQYLQVREWEPKFNPENQRTSLAKVWIKFPGLSLEYWTEENLLTMGKAFGKPIQVDHNTLAMDFGFFASVLVEVDFAKNIPDRVWVEDGDDNTEGFWQSAEIPKVPKFCFHCKIVGHLISECRSKREELIDKSVEVNVNVSNEANTKNKRKSKKSKETLSVAEIQEGTNLAVEVEKLLHSHQDQTATSTSVPLVPPSVVTQNRFQNLGEEEEVATSELVACDSEVSSSKPSSSEPILRSNRRVSSKTKATGLFPNGSLNSKVKGMPKILDDANKISTVGLMEFGSILGMGFPSSKNDRQEMFNSVADNHKDLTIVEA